MRRLVLTSLALLIVVVACGQAQTGATHELVLGAILLTEELAGLGWAYAHGRNRARPSCAENSS